MTTARGIITRALRDLGVYGVGETVSADDAATGLDTLNDMLSVWRNDRLMIPAVIETTHTLDGSISYTIGPSGNINLTRAPQKIESAQVRQGGVDIDVPVHHDPEVWARIPDKTLPGGFPEVLYYERSFPLGRIYLWPQGDSGDSLRLWFWAELSSFADLSDTVTVPDGYEALMRFNLATWLAPAFGVEVPRRVDALAAQTMRSIRKSNVVIPVLTVDHPSIDTGRGNILTGP